MLKRSAYPFDYCTMYYLVSGSLKAIRDPFLPSTEPSLHLPAQSHLQEPVKAPPGSPSTKLHFASQVAALKAEWAKQEEEIKEEERRRQERIHQVRSECEEFNRCPQIDLRQHISQANRKG